MNSEFMQIKMSQTNGSFSEQTSSDRRDEDVVIVKMNMPRRFKVAPGIPTQSQGDLNTTKRSLNLNLVVTKPKEDELHRNSVQDEFATVTVNLLSRPKQEEEESEQSENADNDKNDIRDDVEMQDDDEDSSENENSKEPEEYEESESEESETEIKSVLRTKTPSSVDNVSVAPLVFPNISIPCPKCSSYINICHLRSHRDFHTALQTFKFASDFTPQNLKTLIKRRKTLIKKLQESGKHTNGKGFVDKNLQKINTAFEVLKSELEGTGNTYRVLETDLNPQINKVSNIDMCCTLAVGLCEESNSRWKNMEDTHAYEDRFLDDPPCCFMGIYDGYCGNVTAQKCAKYLHVFLKDEFQEIVVDLNEQLSKECISAAFKRAYHKFQKMLLETTEDEEQSRSRWSGCSALTCLLTSDACFLANAGNVGALLVRDKGIVKVLASRHDLYNKKERDRVRRCRGVIVKTEKCALINGALGTTRGLGNIGDIRINQCIINDPKSKHVKLLDGDQIIVLASSGLWKMFSYEETSMLIFGFFRKIKRDIFNGIVYGDAIPSLLEDGHLANEYENVYERLDNRHSYFEQFLKPKKTTERRYTTVGFRMYSIHTIEEEVEQKPAIHVSIKIPRWSKRIGRRMSDTCLSYHGESLHGDEQGWENDEQTGEDNFEELEGRCCFKRRHSMPHSESLVKLHGLLKTDSLLTRKDKEKLLARYLSRRLVKASILAGSLDNITVFIVLLQGFSLVNVLLITENLLEALDD